MPINVNLASAFEPKDSFAEAAAAWADAVALGFAGIVPPSTTVSTAAKAAFQTAILQAFTARDVNLIDNAFTLFAAQVALGMAPTFVGTPPPSPLGAATVLGTNYPTSAAPASALAAKIALWAVTGLAALAAPPNTVQPWA